MEAGMFYCIAVSVCVFAVLAVVARNIFHSALWLAMMLLSVAGIYFYLEAPFLAVVQILIYVGGIVTLFIFTIMLTERIEDVTIRQTTQLWPSILAAGALFVILARVIAKGPWAKMGGQVIGLEDLGNALMTRYALPFEFISVVLLAALVGAIVLGKVKK